MIDDRRGPAPALISAVGPAMMGPRFTALALMLARNWGVTDLGDVLQAATDELYPPTWDYVRGEMTWDFGLGEPHPLLRQFPDRKECYRVF